MKSNTIKSLGIFFLSVLVLSACRNDDNLIEPTCFDEVKNQGELRVDCGGPNCAECPPTCDDRIQNQDEQSPVSFTNPNVLGIDCGGDFCEPCSTCDDGIQNAHWVRDFNLTEADLSNPIVGQDENGNLYVLIMETGIDCGFPCPQMCVATCDDGIQNGDETNVDCGGSCPDPCPPTCGDGIQNGNETGIDCGDAIEPLDAEPRILGCGPCPDPSCTDGIMNIHIELNDMHPLGYIVVTETGIDCDNNPLSFCPDCPIPTCYDGVQNGSETGVDCGGSCITQCDLTESCSNGIQDGTETGVDCDGDPATDCPPCATCADWIKNGPEFDVDCVDYEIPGFTCPVCPSCHDGVLNPELFELDIDCGAPGCETCLTELTADAIGANGGSGFRDQFSLNKIMAAGGNDDTLHIPNAFTVESFPSGFNNDAYLKVTGKQGIETQNGLLIRTLTVYMPLPHTVEPLGTNVQMEDITPFPGSCEPPFDAEIPYVTYREQLIDNPSLLNKCFFSFEVPGQSSQMQFTYQTGYPEGFRYTHGGVNTGGLLRLDPIADDEIGGFTNIQFKFQYDFF